MTNKEARLICDFIEDIGGYDRAPLMIDAANKASETHEFSRTRDYDGCWLIVARSLALETYVISGCGKVFTPTEFLTRFQMETLNG